MNSIFLPSIFLPLVFLAFPPSPPVLPPTSEIMPSSCCHSICDMRYTRRSGFPCLLGSFLMVSKRDTLPVANMQYASSGAKQPRNACETEFPASSGNYPPIGMVPRGSNQAGPTIWPIQRDYSAHGRNRAEESKIFYRGPLTLVLGLCRIDGFRS